MDNDIILNGIRMGDQIGGPYQLSKVLNESLTSCGGFSKKDLIQRYLKWWKGDAFDTGPTFASVFTHIDNGVDPEEAVKQVNILMNGNTAGCGPAHRIAPLAAFTNIPTSNLFDIAREEASITHFHPDAGNGSAIVVMLCRYLIEGKTWEEAKLLLSKNTYVNKSWQKVLNAEVKSDGYIFNVICSSIYFLDRENSLKNAIKFAGASNYCPIIVGVISNIIKFV